MASKVGICNKALQKVGEQFITSLSDNSEQARACNRVYDDCLTEVLREHPWNFATKRVSLAADVAKPAYEYGYQFQTPADCIRLLEVDGNIQRRLEGNKILCNESGPLYIKYTFNQDDPNQYDSYFKEVLSIRIAIEVVETLTSSNTKKQDLMIMYDRALTRAKMVDSQEDPPYELDEDEWITIRN